MIRTKRSKPRKDGWRDFSTAPKDGTEVQVYRVDAGVFTAHFTSPASMGASDDEEECWFTTGGDDLTGDLPTLWKPLSAPPTENPSPATPETAAKGRNEKGEEIEFKPDAIICVRDIEPRA